MDQQDRSTVVASLKSAVRALEAGSPVRAATVDLDYIRKNLEKLPEHKLDDIEHEIKIQDLYQQTGVYVEQGGEAKAIKLRLDLRKPVDVLVKEIQERVGTGYGDVDFKAYNSLKTIVEWHYMRHKSGNSYTIGLGSYPLASLVNFLFYVMGGDVEPNYRRAHDLLEKRLGINSSAKPPLNFAFEAGGAKVDVKMFQNGRVDVKFSRPDLGPKMAQTLEAWWAKSRG